MPLKAVSGKGSLVLKMMGCSFQEVIELAVHLSWLLR
jgi:hypothetical protein